MSIEEVKAGVAVFCVATLLFFMATKDKRYSKGVDILVAIIQVCLMFVALFLFIFVGVV